MTNDKAKYRDSPSKSDTDYNRSKNPFDRLSNERKHTIFYPYKKHKISFDNSYDRNRKSIIDKLSEETKLPSKQKKILAMQITKQSEDLKSDSYDRNMIKHDVLNYLRNKETSASAIETSH